MFKFLKLNFFKNKEKSEEDEKDKDFVKATVGLKITDSIHDSTIEAGKTFAKSEVYDRKLYDSNYKETFKEEFFKSNKEVVDLYTEKELVINQKIAKANYGEEDWAKHSAETDHIVPLEEIYNSHKNDKWITDADIKDVANKDENYEVISKSINSSKGAKTNEEFVNSVDEKHAISDKNKEAAIERGKKANNYIESSLNSKATKNIIKTGHTAGINSMSSAGTSALAASGILNLISYTKGDISGKEAIKNTVNDTIKSGATGYALGSSLTVISHSLSDSS